MGLEVGAEGQDFGPWAQMWGPGFRAMAYSGLGLWGTRGPCEACVCGGAAGVVRAE